MSRLLTSWFLHCWHILLSFSSGRILIPKAVIYPLARGPSFWYHPCNPSLAAEAGFNLEPRGLPTERVVLFLRASPNSSTSFRSADHRVQRSFGLLLYL